MKKSSLMGKAHACMFSIFVVLFYTPQSNDSLVRN